MSLKSDHIFTLSSSEIDQICEPLKKVGITNFSYLKNFLDGSQINLSNNGLWVEHYYKFKLYETSLFEYNPNLYQPGFLLWPTESNLEVIKHGRTYFNSDNGITIIEIGKGYCEFYFFSGLIKNKWLINFYVNNLDFLNNFCYFFKEKASCLLKQAEKNRIIIPKHYNSQISKETNILISVLKRESLNFRFNVQDDVLHHLTKRELDVSICLLKGKTAKETARDLLISPRTVEEYIENIKCKLKCKNKIQLANKLSLTSLSKS